MFGLLKTAACPCRKPWDNFEMTLGPRRLSGKGTCSTRGGSRTFVNPDLTRRISVSSWQDGYTLETLDIYTIDDGIESVVIHDVRLLPFFMFNVYQNTPMTGRSHARHMYVPTLAFKVITLT